VLRRCTAWFLVDRLFASRSAALKVVVRVREAMFAS